MRSGKTAFRSRNSGSGIFGAAGSISGDLPRVTDGMSSWGVVLVAESIGLVTRSSGISPSVSKTKNASPASPIFMLNGTGFPLMYTLT